MHLRNHENFKKMKHKNFTLGGFRPGVFVLGVLSGWFLSGVYVRGVFVQEPGPVTSVGTNWERFQRN